MSDHHAWAGRYLGPRGVGRRRRLRIRSVSRRNREVRSAVVRRRALAGRRFILRRLYFLGWRERVFEDGNAVFVEVENSDRDELVVVAGLDVAARGKTCVREA